jgi:hypothetical protein
MQHVKFSPNTKGGSKTPKADYKSSVTFLDLDNNRRLNSFHEDNSNSLFSQLPITDAPLLWRDVGRTVLGHKGWRIQIHSSLSRIYTVIKKFVENALLLHKFDLTLSGIKNYVLIYFHAAIDLQNYWQLTYSLKIKVTNRVPVKIMSRLWKSRLQFSSKPPDVWPI